MYPKLDVKTMITPILKNYNTHALRFYSILESISCELIYDGPDNFHDHIRDKTVYACSVKCYPTTNTTTNKKFKVLKFLFPIMIGSNLDLCIRKKGLKRFSRKDLLSSSIYTNHFEIADIASTFFVINGYVRQLPYFFTNDPTNTHVIKRKFVRCYTYDSDDRGKELTLYLEDVGQRYKRGDVIVTLNDGSEQKDVQDFFDHCPYPVDQDAYMYKVYNDGNFDIDHLANKIVVSPGHLFVKLFMKYLYRPVKDRDWVIVKSKMSYVVKSIETGTLLHVLSRKTLYFKESNSAPKMVSTPQENHREIGMNGEVYVEKNTGCYREVTMQTYPLNPYLSHIIVRQISCKVKKGLATAFHPSYVGFFCIVGTFETKHVGRTNMMVRDTHVSTCDKIDKVYQILPKLELNCGGDKEFYVVVNEACVPVTKQCFRQIKLKDLKRNLKFIECFRDRNFILIRYKIGLFFKKIDCIDEDIWVTARDEWFWRKTLYSTPTPKSFHSLTSYIVDLNPFFNYNIFTKNILAFNTLKSAVLATDSRYSEYFMETFSAYVTEITHQHRIVCEPVDEFSSHFVLRVPLIKVAYMSYLGMNQEDCIVVRDDLRLFDCFRFYTVRIRFDTKSSSSNKNYVTFHPIKGHSIRDDAFLGHLVFHDQQENHEIQPISLTTHVKLVKMDNNNNNSIYQIFFSKPGFKIVVYHLSKNQLAISLKKLHVSDTGDKLCSFHGQKGVMRTYDTMPRFGEFQQQPDIIVNPYSLFRMTCGQIKEGIYRGGKDVHVIRNSDGKLMSTTNDGIFLAETFYFPVSYWASEHIYAPRECVIDKILGQAVKGRSRGGGMRLGNMEIMNGMRGNGLASCFEEKVLEHGDRTFCNLGDDSGPIPKSAILCREDAKFFKCDINFKMEPCMIEDVGN